MENEFEVAINFPWKVEIEKKILEHCYTGQRWTDRRMTYYDKTSLESSAQVS